MTHLALSQELAGNRRYLEDRESPGCRAASKINKFKQITDFSLALLVTTLIFWHISISPLHLEQGAAPAPALLHPPSKVWQCLISPVPAFGSPSPDSQRCSALGKTAGQGAALGRNVKADLVLGN